MSRPTPETDAAVKRFFKRTYTGACVCVDADDMRRLENKRDAAVEALKAADKHFADYLESIAPFASTEELKVELNQTRSGKLHTVIRAVLRGDEGRDCTTGRAMGCHPRRR